MGWLSRSLGMLLVMVLLSAGTQAQTWAEWFKQKKTQKKYLLQQIAALEVYGSYLKKGYQVANEGLSFIRDVTGGEFKLHEAFIYGLKKVSPAVSGDYRIAEVISIQVSIIGAFSAARSSPYLSAENLGYIALVSGEVMAECLDDLQELLLVVTSGKLEMKEDERLARIGVLHSRMLDKHAFVQDFAGNVQLLIRQRESAQRELSEVIQMFHFKE